MDRKDAASTPPKPPKNSVSQPEQPSTRDSKKPSNGMIKTINIEISPGELIDRYSIVLIKREMIPDEEKLQSIHIEITRLKTTFEALSIPDRDIHLINLYKLNRAIWDKEEDIRDIHRASAIGSIWWSNKNKLIRAGEIGIAIAILNDRRCTIKREINQSCGYAVLEEKSHISSENT